jgi:hypothetical protein
VLIIIVVGDRLATLLQRHRLLRLIAELIGCFRRLCFQQVRLGLITILALAVHGISIMPF